MIRDRKKLKIPMGMRDWLPGEALEKRALEQKCLELFQSWGYWEVITPMLEYLDTLSASSGEELGSSLFQFFDRQGQIVALRPEMTTSIARLAASRLYDRPMPQRLFYLANVFRYQDTGAGRQREMVQAGVELLGAEGPLADAEVIALAVNALRASGLKVFQVSVGQNEVFNGLMDELPLQEAEKVQVRQLVAKKDFVGLEELVCSSSLSKEQRDLLLLVPTLHGQREILDKAQVLAVNLRSRQGLENLKQVYDALCSYGVEQEIALDLGVLRGLNYYTGVVFEAYATGAGFPVCGGGRYDHLLGQMGYPCPATGFALELDRILSALTRQGTTLAKGGIDVLLVAKDGELAADSCGAILKQAAELRSRGLKVEAELNPRSPEQRQAYIQSKGIEKVIFVSSDKEAGR